MVWKWLGRLRRQREAGKRTNEVSEVRKLLYGIRTISRRYDVVPPEQDLPAVEIRSQSRVDRWRD
jgi:hypothetical protein